jgi:hypothetical protein
MEMTGYFKMIDSEEQIIALIARQGRVEVTVGTMATLSWDVERGRRRLLQEKAVAR